MILDLPTLLAIAAVVTAVLWIGAVVARRVDWSVVGPGIRNGLLAAIGLFLIVAVLVTVAFNGRGFVLVTLDLGGSLGLGLIVGAVVGVGFFWLGAALMPVGLFFRGGYDWARYGTWAAVPIIVVSAGLGYTAYSAVQQQGTEPTPANGTVSIELHGQRLGTATAAGAGTCQVASDGSLRVQAGTGIGGATFNSAEGRPITVDFHMAADGSEPSIVLTVGGTQAFPGKGWRPGPATMAIASGSTSNDGEVALTDLVPLGDKSVPDPTERWSGTFHWTCAR